ncbi:hypothetical protein [Ferrimonas balearica]|uniref:hypothetical protein n=1 Tax=Ferrimonas balearica TaxID=44012 RepID=UPI001F48F9C6|nr:hypothetical protein [Ferrimonas balearica]MBY6016370.1 hypothetical protein [Halomonas denitrificans]MBY6095359.1 hypothetical protein [Ferrimonas balearica]
MSFWYAITALGAAILGIGLWRLRQRHLAALRRSAIEACRHGVNFAEQVMHLSKLLNVHPLLLAHLDQQMVQAQLTIATLAPSDTAFAQRLRVVRQSIAQRQSAGHEGTELLCPPPRTDKQHIAVLVAIRKQRQLARAAHRAGALKDQEHAELDAQLLNLQVAINISSVEQRATAAISRGQNAVAERLLLKGLQILAHRTDADSQVSHQRLLALYRRLLADNLAA